MASIAIVGAGPSGCFTAQALLKALPEAQIDIIDRLPVPYGLVRYGVATDHQSTKNVIRQFERLFERHGVGFFGNVHIGQDVALDELSSLYDAVVLATGLPDDRRLGIPGEDLEGVYGSGVVTRAWNDHPDADGVEPEIGRDVVIMGNGNVAIDLLRLLAKTEAELEGSDLSEKHSKALANGAPRRIHVVGRSSAESAKFDPVMLRELSKLSQARIVVEDAVGEGKVIEALNAINGHSQSGALHQIVFRFGWTPKQLTGGPQVSQAHFRATSENGETLAIACDTFLTAIGFQGTADSLADGEASEDGFLRDGIYATGWFRRGPRGTIPENRADAQVVAKRIASDLVPASDKPGRDALAERLSNVVRYDGWKRIDAAERENCREDRCRRKIPNRSEMLKIANSTGEHA